MDLLVGKAQNSNGPNNLTNTSHKWQFLEIDQPIVGLIMLIFIHAHLVI